MRPHTPIRVRPVPPRTGRKISTHCVECGAFTMQDKPYCPEHILSSPYVASVAARVEQREAEERAGRLSIRGAVAEELLDLLRLGPASHRWLARRLRVDRDAVADLLRRMKHRGMVREQPGKRHSYWEAK